MGFIELWELRRSGWVGAFSVVRSDLNRSMSYHTEGTIGDTMPVGGVGL